MNRSAKVGLVCAGYALAIVAGVVASHLYNARMAAMPYDTSGGMYAEGESLSWLAAFLGVALIPTLLALWFLRRNQKFWQAIAIGSLGFAIVGLLAVLTTLAVHGGSRSPVMIVIELLGLAQLLGVPLWTLAFMLFAAIAPEGSPKRLLVGALGLELVIAVCAVFHWLVPMSRR